MWEIYGRDSNAVAVQTTVGRMREHIAPSNLRGHSLRLKPVLYKKSEDVSGILSYEDCFFIKRPHFSFEKEVRISFDTYCRQRPTKDTPCGYDLPVSVNEFIETIYVHPDSKQWFLDVVASITKRYEVHASVKLGVLGNM